MKVDRILPLMSDTINLILHLMLHTEFALTRACVCVMCSPTLLIVCSTQTLSCSCQGGATEWSQQA